MNGTITLGSNSITPLTSSSLTGYATQSWVQQQGYLTSASLNGYATQTWVGQQGYLTASAISDILKDYAEEKTKDTGDIVKAVAKKGALAIKNESLEKFRPAGLKKGRYGTGWTTTIEEKRLGTVATIHNAKYPGLPHLLENGHTLRNGQFWQGKPHISVAEEKIVDEFEEEVMKSI